MISIDTNILFPLVVEDHPRHAAAAAFAKSLEARDDVAVSEFATVNQKDFDGFGFEKVWNPISIQP